MFRFHDSFQLIHFSKIKQCSCLSCPLLALLLIWQTLLNFIMIARYNCNSWTDTYLARIFSKMSPSSILSLKFRSIFLLIWVIYLSKLVILISFLWKLVYWPHPTVDGARWFFQSRNTCRSNSRLVFLCHCFLLNVGQKSIDWILHYWWSYFNLCNWSNSFCSSISKDGSSKKINLHSHFIF